MMQEPNKIACTAKEIAEKRRLAQERLKQTKASAQMSNSISAGASTKTFYGNGHNPLANTLNKYEKKIKQQQTHSFSNRISSQPYPRNGNEQPTNNDQQKRYMNVTTCSCVMITPKRFQVIQKGYHKKLIDIFKTIPTRSYDSETKNWSFDLNVYEEVQKKVSELNPHVVIGQLPKFVLKLLREEIKKPDFFCLDAIEKTLSSQLLDFQKYGVAFGVSQGGRCMIADDMGLGKTYQAIGIADFYKEDWPLLIVTTATARGGWERHIKNLLPWVPNDSIKSLESVQCYVSNCKVLILSYTLLNQISDKLAERGFGCIILDESHLVKNYKTKSTQSATRLCEKAKRVILLSGTPALSRPDELFSQLSLIDKSFFGGFKAYAVRYCNGKEGHFGLNTSGSSNETELNIILQRKFMIRRTKLQVDFELGAKTRETVLLDSEKVWSQNDVNMRDTIENCKEFIADVERKEGNDRKEILLRLYAESAKLKANAVCTYVNNLVQQKIKFIVFGHHKVMLDALSDSLNLLRVNFIRIDGSTRNDLRNVYIDRFQHDESYQVAVLSLKACNAAITLTAASLVVFAELDWNPSTLAQCEARAHRLGQKKPVICRYLLAMGTADDYIWNMVKGKQDVLSKAGIFSEDLTDATHSTVSISSNGEVINYSESQRRDSKTICQNHNNNNNNNDGENQQPTQQMNIKYNGVDYRHLLDDEDDDVMLSLNI